ncbi:MAG: hypothetical protein EOO88_12495 [Pedobacter sp.]|nr:MAG: hypothetical protein EOO88_12495 [Pedobacter sp.]
MEKTDLDFAYYIYLVRTNKEGKMLDFSTLSNSWNYNSVNGDPGYSIIAGYFNKPGQYKVIIAPELTTSSELSELSHRHAQISFIVTPAIRAFSLREMGIIAMLILMVITCVALLIIEYNKKKSRKKIMLAHFNAEAAKGELDQIRSHLNPHFVYNSLSGIQNLMNQNETEKANSYLNKFARLTRNILNDQELISIQDERNLLDDYLSMESLRFKFSYEINIIGDANFPNAEIPAMLLQPFVENAVKHNMAILQDKGKLLIELKSEQKNVILSVIDNGNGFETQKNYAGLGLKLCRKRIELLNQLYKECPISMNINSGTTGTTVTIILENWL